MTVRTVWPRLAAAPAGTVFARSGPLVRTATVAGVAVVVLQVSSASVREPRFFVASIVALLAVATWCLVADELGVATAVRALLIAVLVGFVAEFVGTRTGVPFGTYRYSDRLVPAVAGVPAVVLLAWFAMGVPARALAAIVIPGGRAGAVVARIALGAAALSAWDLFLDPQMVALGYWSWPGGGLYFGVPVSNYVGWFAVSAVLMALLEWILSTPRRTRRHGLLALYSSMAVVETVGFLGPLQWRPAVAIIGGCFMGVPAVLAWWCAKRPGGSHG